MNNDESTKQWRNNNDGWMSEYLKKWMNAQLYNK